MARIDTTVTRSYRQSPGKTGLLLLAAAVFVAGGLFGAVSLDPLQDWRAYVAYLTLAFFGPCALVLLYRIFTLHGDVLVISPEGLLDRRLSERTIPWTAIWGISTFAYQGQRVLFLRVDPDVEPLLGLNLLARLNRRANSAIGLHGLAVAAVDLNVRFEELLAVTRAYAAAAAEQQA